MSTEDTGVKTTNSGILVETFRHGDIVALHAVAERPGGGFDYYHLNRGNHQWTGPLASFGSTGNIHGPVVCLGMNNQLEVIYREVAGNLAPATTREQPGRLMATRRNSIDKEWERDLYPWAESKGRRTVLPAPAAIGTPGVCRWQGWNAGVGMDVLAPIQSGGLQHWWRDDKNEWHTGDVVKFDTKFRHCAMALGHKKRLDVVAVDDSGMLWVLSRMLGKWNATPYTRLYTSNPTLVASKRDGVEYEVVVAAGGQLLHHVLVFTEDGFLELKGEVRFGGPGVDYHEVGLVLNNAGHLDVVARRSDGVLEHFVNLLDNQGWKRGIKMPVADQGGSWSIEFNTKIIGVHQALLHTGEVFLTGMADTSEFEGRAGVLNWKTGEYQHIDLIDHHVPHAFCGGQALMGNGDVLVAGGHNNHEEKLFVLARNEEKKKWLWEKRPSFLEKRGRWYPTCTTLPDGKVLILSGSIKYNDANDGAVNNTYEIYDPARPLIDPRPVIDLFQEIHAQFCDNDRVISTYPLVFVLPQKRLFVHSHYTTRFVDYLQMAGTWSPRYNANYRSSRSYPSQGPSVLLPLRPDEKGNYPGAQVVLFGGAGPGPDNGKLPIDRPATNSVEFMTTDGPGPKWESNPNSLLTARVMGDAVLLPDGNVLILGGSRAGLGSGKQSRQPVFSVELYRPDKKTFTRLAPMYTPRLYHVATSLLPDGRVLVTGKDQAFHEEPYAYPEHRGEVFTPSYLLTRKPRPRIVAATETITNGSQMIEITVADVPAEEIRDVILIRPSTTTHSLNMDQRSVYLTCQGKKSGKVLAQAPKTNWVVPPGYYMLFLVSEAGVPSEAKFVRVAVFPASDV